MAREKRQLLLGTQARSYLLDGIKKLSSAVKVTLGAEGKHVVIEDKDYNYPIVTRDGVAVAESISFGDNRLEQGARLAKDAARETWREAGDGTTSTIVITESLCESINAYIEPSCTSIHNGDVLRAGKKPNCLAKGIRQAAADAIEAVIEISKPVTKEDLVNVAIISANNDEEMGAMVADIVWQVGENGSVIVKQGKEATKVEILQGSILKAGYITKEFVNNDFGTHSQYEPVIFVTDFSFSKSADVVAILTEHNKKMGSAPLVIIAREFIGDARSAFVQVYLKNRQQAMFPVVCIEAPFEGDQMRDALRDIATATGATFLGEEKGYAIKNMYEGSYFGKCKRVEVYDDETRFVGGVGSQKDIDVLVKALKKEIEKADSSDKENHIKNRIAWLTGKVALVHVGGSTPTEKISKMHRLDDSIRSSKAALDDGMVIGGGAAYLYAYHKLQDKIKQWDSDYCDSHFYAGYEALMESLLHPMTQIMINSSMEDSEIDAMIDEFLEDIAEGKMVTYNVITQQKEFVEDTHIFDSSKVIKTAISKAASVGAVFATTEVLNYDELRFYVNLRENTI